VSSAPCIVRVVPQKALPIGSGNHEGIFDYRLDPHQSPKNSSLAALIGRRVLISFGNRKLSGFIVETSTQSTQTTLKTILEILEEPQLISAALVSFFKLVANSYCVGLGEVIATAVPPFTAFQQRQTVQLSEFGKRTMVIDPQEQLEDL
jgi:primosomal protein N' (replication factor Y)